MPKKSKNQTSTDDINKRHAMFFSHSGHKQISALLMNGLMGVLIIAALVAIPAIRNYGASLRPTRTLSVRALGKVIAEPDIAHLSFSVISEGLSPKQLQDDNHEKMNNVLTFIKNRGIAEEDIKTTAYNLSPRYEYDEIRRQASFISGYMLTQSVTIKIRDFEEVAKIIGGLAELGVNQISSATFSIEDTEVYLAEARKEAFEKAHEKARQIAKENNVRLRGVIEIYEIASPAPYYRTFGLSDVAMKRGVDGAAPDIQPGTEEITTTVNITFEL